MVKYYHKIVVKTDLIVYYLFAGKEPSKSSNHETFLLCAASDEERQEWIKAIKRVMYSSLGGGNNLTLYILGKISADDILEYFTYFT